MEISGIRARAVQALAAGTIALIAPFLLPAPATAAEPADCKALVVDDAGVLDVPRVTRAAERVQEQAADIRVRTYRSVPNGDLDAYFRALYRDCKTWQGTQGDVKDNLVVLMVSVDDRRTGLYYGSVYTSVLDKKWPGIQADYTNPRFHDGDFTAGMVAGLGRIAFFVDPSYSPHPNGGGHHGDGGGFNGGPLTGSNPEPSASGASPFVVLAALVGIAALVGLGYGGVALRRRSRERAGARARAATARGEMQDAFTQLDEDSEFSNARVDAVPHVDDPLLHEITELATAARAASAAANDHYLAAEEAALERRIPAMSTAQAAEAAATMDQARDGLRAAIADWDVLTAKLDELDTLRTELPARLDAISAVAEQTRTTAAARAQDGFRVDDYLTLTGRYDTEVDEIRALVVAHRVGEADQRATGLGARAQATLTTVDGLARWRDRLRADLDRLRALAADREKGLVDAKAVAVVIADGYHRECSAGLGEALTAADRDLARVREAIRELDTATAMAAQRWADGDTLVGEADRLLAEVADDVAVPHDRQQELAALATLLPTGVSEARAAITVLDGDLTAQAEAVAFLDVPPDVPALLASLDEVTDLLTPGSGPEGRPELMSAQRGLAAVRERLQVARTAVDDVVAEHARVRSLLGDATTTVAQAAEESSRAHAGSAARTLADTAREDLQAAQSAIALSAVAAHAQDAMANATQAITLARDAIRQHREQNTRRGAFLGVGAGAGFGAGSSGFGGFGGGGGGGHHGGGFGGGSSGFGGGGGGGGHHGGGGGGGGSSSF